MVVRRRMSSRRESIQSHALCVIMAHQRMYFLGRHGKPPTHLLPRRPGGLKIRLECPRPSKGTNET
jgi:hypothetical protein